MRTKDPAFCGHARRDFLLGGDITYLDAGEAAMAEGYGGYERAWDLWKRKAMGR